MPRRLSRLGSLFCFVRMGVAKVLPWRAQSYFGAIEHFFCKILQKDADSSIKRREERYTDRVGTGTVGKAAIPTCGFLHFQASWRIWGESIGRILRCSDSISFSCRFFAYWVWTHKSAVWQPLLFLREQMGIIAISLSGSSPSFGKCILARQSKLRLHSLSFLFGFLNLLTIPSDHFEN